ncbi:MAG: DUF5610 domain-containing protein [Nitrospinota bacterium]
MDAIRIDKKETGINPPVTRGQVREERAGQASGKKVTTPSKPPAHSALASGDAEGSEHVVISTFFQTLRQMVKEYFSSFPRIVVSEGQTEQEASAQEESQKAAFALEGAYRASINIQFEDEEAGGKIDGYIAHTEEAKVNIHVKSFGEVRKEAPQASDLPDDRAADLAGRFSSENISGRTAEFAIGLYEGFANRHPEMSEVQAKAAFREMAVKAIDKGFGEAKRIVGGMSAQSDAKMNRTHELTMQKLVSGLGA